MVDKGGRTTWQIRPTHGTACDTRPMTGRIGFSLQERIQVDAMRAEDRGGNDEEQDHDGAHQ